MPKYLIEIILVVEAKNTQEARKIADYILNLPIPDPNIENAIETMRYEEVVQIKNPRA
jgi:glycerol-3-phosphate O-acyltransferase